MRSRIAAYAISGLLAAGAGLFVAAQTGSGDPVIGTAFTLNSIAAAVLGGVGFLGGRGTMRGAIAGSLLLSVMINVMFFLGFPPVAQYVAQGLIIIGAVALPEITGRRGRDERDRERTTRFPPRRIGALLRNRAFLTFVIVALVWIVAGFAKPRLRLLRPPALSRSNSPR